MPGRSYIWTPAKIKHARATLGKSPDVRAAAHALGVTASALDQAMYRAGTTAFACLAPSAQRAAARVPDEPPRERHARVSREAKLTAQVKELVGQVERAEARAELIDRIARPVIPNLTRRERKSGLREAAAIVLASDWHVEETVEPVQVAGRNEYNLEISKRRAERFFAAVLWRLAHHRSAFRITDLVLWLGGDLISGYIHDELAESNALSPVEALLFVQRLLTDGIARLLEHGKLERLVIPCSHGNHGRTTQKRRIQTGAENSYEWLLYNQLALAFAGDNRVEFVIDKSAHQWVDVFGFGLHFHHGDELKYGGGVGGIGIPLLKRVPQWNTMRQSHVHHVGHFHMLRDFHSAFVNGSLIGPSPYGMSIGAGYEPPEQLMYLLDSKRGPCMKSALWVSE